MSVVLKLVGIVSCLMGLILFAAALPATGGGGTVTAATIFAVAPGIAAIVNGLLVIAGGVALEDLGRIAKASEKTAHLLNEQFGPGR